MVSEKYSDNDYFIKARIYKKFGVLEYNIVEPSGSITQYRLINGHYEHLRCLKIMRFIIVLYLMI